MRLSTSACLVLIAVALSSSIAGCDEVSKAVDANNNQPGEADGRAQELAKIPQRLVSLAFDTKELWVIGENGDILKGPIDGSATPSKVGGYTRADADTARALLDADFLYILDEKAVSRMPRAGGPVEKLANAAPSNLAQSAEALFAVSSDTKKILRIDKLTKATTEMATGFVAIGDIAIEGERILVADREGEVIASIATKDGARTDLATNQSRPYRIGLGTGYVYWANGAFSDKNQAVEDRVLRLKLDGSGPPETVIAKTDGFLSRLAGDAQFLYFDKGCRGLYRVPATGGTSSKFLNAAVQEFDVTADRVVVMEDNSCRFDEAAKSQPNRVLSAAK